GRALDFDGHMTSSLPESGPAVRGAGVMGSARGRDGRGDVRSPGRGREVSDADLSQPKTAAAAATTLLAWVTHPKGRWQRFFPTTAAPVASPSRPALSAPDASPGLIPRNPHPGRNNPASSRNPDRWVPLWEHFRYRTSQPRPALGFFMYERL